MGVLATIDWPFPPSVNGLYDGGHKTHRRFKSARYNAWLQKLSGQSRVTINGPVTAVYALCPPDKRVRDLGNYEKAVSDALVSHGYLKDDSQIRRMTLWWVAQSQAPLGLRITIGALDEAAMQEVAA